MIRIGQIKIKHDEKMDYGTKAMVSFLTKKACKMLKIQESNIESLSIVKHSLDARKKPELYHIYTIDLKVIGKPEEKIVKACRDKNVSVVSEKAYDFWSHVGGEEGKRKDLEEKRIVIIGCGPAGLFCGYELLRRIKSISHT